VEPAKDDLNAALEEDDELTEEATLGYAQIDILDLPLAFGTWNVRQVSAIEVTRIQESMEKEGVQRYRPQNFLPIAVRKESIDVAKLAQNPRAGHRLPNLAVAWTEGQPESIIACGGQHRREALKKILEALEKEGKRLLAALEKEKEKAGGFVAQMTRELDSHKQRMRLMGLWGVCIYDLSEFLSLIDSRKVLNTCRFN